MKLKPVAPTQCIRCNTKLDALVGQVRAVCSPCDYALQVMHRNAEYTMYRRTYYSISLEGTTLEWLLANDYTKEISKPSPAILFVPTLRPSVAVDQASKTWAARFDNPTKRATAVVVDQAPVNSS